MLFTLVHKLPGRIRLRGIRYAFDDKQGIALACTLEQETGVTRVQTRAASSSVLIEYDPAQTTEAAVLARLRELDPATLEIPASAGPRLANLELGQNLTRSILKRCAFRLFLRVLPLGNLRYPITLWRARHYLAAGWRSLKARRFDVSLLDATAILLPTLLGNPEEAASLLFLLGISEELEEYTIQKARNSLADSMALQVDLVWQLIPDENGGEPTLRHTAASDIKPGDLVRVEAGSLIPFDGDVVAGSALVNQASLTGEAEPIFRQEHHSVLAGTTITEGTLDICVRKTLGESRIQQIVHLLERAEDSKAPLQSQAERLADKLVPWNFLLAGVILLTTRSLYRVANVMAVDFSCALKLALPITVISAMQSAAKRQVAIRGGDRLEAFAHAKTLVLDKTGTLTTSEPVLQKVIPLGHFTRNDVLRMAACIEEHFPHSLATAVVKAARDEKLAHAEFHSKVRYIVAHGVVTDYAGHDARIGSYHFIFEDSKVPLPENFAELKEETGGYSTLYLAYDQELVGILCIDEPLRPEAPEVLAKLRKAGFTHMVLLTGDGPQAAARVARELGLDEFHAECLPEDKVRILQELQAKHGPVVMVGDGVNDSPALAQADVSVAMHEASDLARETADISLLSSDLRGLVELRHLANDMLKRAAWNYSWIIGFNAFLLGLGTFAILPASTLSLLHNASTLALCSSNMVPYVDAETAEQRLLPPSMPELLPV